MALRWGLAAAVAGLLHAAPAAAQAGAQADAEPRRQFEEFKRRFGKAYASEAEEEQRYALFRGALERVAEGNRRNGAPVFGVTWMSDRLPGESYQRGRKGKGGASPADEAPVFDARDNRGIPAMGLPASIDWRLSRAVTPVKNQGQCGSCWAFSTAEEVESMYALHVSGNYSETFSAQQINSCVELSDGCGGGDTVLAYEYLKNSPGLASSFFWPYEEGLTPADGCTDKGCTQKCSRDLSQLSTYEFYIGPHATVTGYSYAVPPCSGACDKQPMDQLASALVNAGPISVCLNAGAWNDYVGGVLTAQGCGSMSAADVDHCVQLVGYNASSETPYWIVRNSWSASFGEEGYIYLEYGRNTCGLANEATIAEVAGMGTPEANARFERLREAAIGEKGAARDAGSLGVLLF